MEKVWTERRICTEDQLIRIMPNEDHDCVLIQIHELNDEKSKCQIYLSYDEATMLAKQLCGFVDDNPSSTE